MSKLEQEIRAPKFESAENKKTFSMKDFLVQMKQRIVEYVTGLISKDTDPEEYLEKSGSSEPLEEAVRAGEEAGLYHEKMTLNSLRGTDLEYNSEKPALGGVDHFKITVLRLLDKISINDLASDNFRSPVVDSLRESSEPHQICLNRFKREDEQSTITEAVENIRLGENDSFTYSSLIFEDLKTGKSIDLNRLLPKTVFFAPSSFCEEETYVDKNEKDSKKMVKRKRLHTDLHDFQNFSGQKGIFYARGGFEVGYGDLAKTGGILSLLHEIAHSWQQKYRKKENFEDNYLNAVINLGRLAGYKKKLENGEEDDGYTAFFVNHYLDELKKQGIEIDESNFLYHGQELKPGEAIIKDENVSYIVKSSKFEKLVYNFEKDERDAWAHALMTVRYLRRKGIDLEPGMKTLNDFKKYIDPCLDSYQESTTQEIELHQRDIRFLRKSKEIE